MNSKDLNAYGVFTFEWGQKDGKIERVTLPPLGLGDIYGTYNVIKRIESDQDLVDFAGYMLASLFGSMPSQEAINRIHQSVLALKKMGESLYWETAEDPVISYCYTQLRSGMSRKDAAQIAADVLGKPFTTEDEQGIWTDAWRKRVDRWAADDRRQLPPIGKPRKRTKISGK